MTTRIVVLGAGFGGLTTALEVRQRLGDEAEIVVVARDDAFVFQPSLVWVPFGLRTRGDVTFPLRPLFDENGIAFRHAGVVAIDAADRVVVTSNGLERYDELVIATGAHAEEGAIPGLREHAQTLGSYAEAERALVAYERFLLNPGPAVVAIAPHAADVPGAYEFAFNLAHHLRERGPAGWQHVTIVTPEPYAGHFGLGPLGASSELVERLVHRYDIDVVTGAWIAEVRERELVLVGGKRVPFAFAMVAPPAVGLPVLRNAADRRGFVRVDGAYEVEGHPEIHAVGSAVSVAPVDAGVPDVGFPKSGHLAVQMAHVVAHNVAAAIRGQPKQVAPPWTLDTKLLLDAGNTGLVVSAERAQEPHGRTVAMEGAPAHWAKVAFEKYFLATRRRGYAG